MIPKSLSINDVLEKNKYKYSVCTIYTKQKLYEEMLCSFTDAGFNGDDVEFLHIDNSNKNNFDAYESVKKILNIAEGKYVIICHQDILIKDKREHLDKLLDELEIYDPKWALAGNAGGVNFKNYSSYFMNPDEKLEYKNCFPSKVYSLDEDFIIFKRSVRITPSVDMTGFHFYGTDMCIQADMCGYSAYVIKFLVLHKGYGVTDKQFFLDKEKFRLIYKKHLRTRSIQTTCTRMILSGSRFFSGLYNSKMIVFLVKEYYKRIKN